MGRGCCLLVRKVFRKNLGMREWAPPSFPYSQGYPLRDLNGEGGADGGEGGWPVPNCLDLLICPQLFCFGGPYLFWVFVFWCLCVPSYVSLCLLLCEGQTMSWGFLVLCGVWAGLIELIGFLELIDSLYTSTHEETTRAWGFLFSFVRILIVWIYQTIKMHRNYCLDLVNQTPICALYWMH